METADIVYEDSTGELMRHLTTLGYLGTAIWSSRRPKVYIEVKSTPEPLEHAFFCSQSQVDRMESMRLENFLGQNAIYFIARVFRMSSTSTGLRLYLDPARLRSEGSLLFKANKYAVTPSDA